LDISQKEHLAGKNPYRIPGRYLPESVEEENRAEPVNLTGKQAVKAEMMVMMMM